MVRTWFGTKRRRSPLPPPSESDNSVEDVTPAAPSPAVQSSQSRESSPPPETTRKSTPKSSQPPPPAAASSSQPPIRDPAPDLLRNFIHRTVNPLPYDPADRCSINRYHQSKLDAETPSLWQPPYEPLTNRFLTDQGRIRYSQFRRRELHEQRYLSTGPTDVADMMKLIEANRLRETILEIDPFVKEIVWEFYSNFHIINDVTLKSKVFVRRKLYEFSPQMINKVFRTPVVKWHPTSELDRVKLTKHALAAKLTNDEVTDWHALKASTLPEHLAAMYSLCCYNWMPSTNNSNVTYDRAKILYMLQENIVFNFGKLVYDQVLQAACSPTQSRNILPFPNLIYRVLTFQRDINLEDYEKLDMTKPKGFTPDVRGAPVKARKPRRGAYAFGTSLAGDLRHTASLLVDMAARLEGGDYDLAPYAQSSHGNAESGAQGFETEADDTEARNEEAVDDKWADYSSSEDSEQEYDEEGYEDETSDT